LETFGDKKDHVIGKIS